MELAFVSCDASAGITSCWWHHKCTTQFLSPDDCNELQHDFASCDITCIGFCIMWCWLNCQWYHSSLDHNDWNQVEDDFFGHVMSLPSELASSDFNDITAFLRLRWSKWGTADFLGRLTLLVLVLPSHDTCIGITCCCEHCQWHYYIP